jgi:hypothetical protein
MQCHEVRELLDSYLGQELMVETTHELMRHLDACPECRAELDARRQLRAAVLKAFTSSDALRPRPDFSGDVLARVRTTAGRRSGGQAWRWGALAASLLLVASLGALVMRDRVAGIVKDAVGDHRNCAVRFALTEKPISLSEAAARFDPTFARLETTPPDELSTDAGPLRVRARHSCVFAGRRFGHVVMDLDGHLVSLLVTERTGPLARWPASIPQQLDGQHVAGLDVAGRSAFVVSDLDEARFRPVVQALTGSVAERLAVLAGWSPHD